MQSIEEALFHFSEGSRLLQRWSQVERSQIPQLSTDERMQELEERLNRTMEERWLQFQRTLENMVIENVEALVMQNLERMVINAVETKVEEKMAEMENRLCERLRDRQTDEAAGVSSNEETVNKESIDALHSKLLLLEASVQKALEIMFPRVEALLSQLEEQSMLTSSFDCRLNQKSKLPASSSSLLVLPLRNPQFPKSSTGTKGRIPTKKSECSSTQHYGVDGLIEAARDGRSDEIRFLLDIGVNVNSCDSCGNSALYWSAFRGHSKTLSLLLQRGADVNVKNVDGWTPLHAAAWKGLENCISKMLDAGAEIEARNERGQTPLHIAAHYGHEKSAQALITEGARINAKDVEGRTPFDLAITSDLRRMLRHENVRN